VGCGLTVVGFLAAYRALIRKRDDEFESPGTQAGPFGRAALLDVHDPRASVASDPRCRAHSSADLSAAMAVVMVNRST
jgi:hypothetical protein